MTPSEGDRAYQLWRCRKNDCAATQQSLFQTREAGRLLIRDGRALGTTAASRRAPWMIARADRHRRSRVDRPERRRRYARVLGFGPGQCAPFLSPHRLRRAFRSAHRCGAIIDAAVDEGHFFWAVWESSTKRTHPISTQMHGSPLSPSASVLDLPMISSLGSDSTASFIGVKTCRAVSSLRTRKVLASVNEPRVTFWRRGNIIF